MDGGADIEFPWERRSSISRARVPTTWHFIDVEEVVEKKKMNFQIAIDIEVRRNENIYISTKDESFYIGRIDGDGDVRLCEDVPVYMKEKDVAEAVCRCIEESDPDDWHWHFDDTPTSIRKLYQKHRATQHLTCREFISAYQRIRSHAISLWDIAAALPPKEFKIWRATECLPLYGELVHIVDVWRLRVEYEVLTV
jgi:hypothetical protein